MRFLLILYVSAGIFSAGAQTLEDAKDSLEVRKNKTSVKAKTFFGIASYYADKFIGRKTATGAIYSHTKATAACNILPLGTWIRVTNLRNKRSVIVQVNDRLHHRNKRIVDMSRSGAEKLGYIGRGLTQVKVEVVERKSK
ncbi:MAG: septal ring lytic transglycosylase RlpA family protein [Chitinophagaceae bacterium]